jgi:lysophospholipase L1-like esterase
MSAHETARLRVLVKGSSLVFKTPERVVARGDHGFPRWLEVELGRLGVDAQCWSAGRLSEPTSAAFDEWQPQVLAWGPDVVVLGYGFYECIHAFLPRWLEVHVNSTRARPGPFRRRYRRYLLRPVWKGLAQLQRVLDGRIQDRFFDRRRRRVLTDYAELVRRTRDASSPLVVVLELLPPGGRAGSWFPGMASRIEAMNRGLHEMVRSLGDPEVRIVPVADIAKGLGHGEDPVPDGLHYSPQMRRLLGRAVAQDVERWWRRQGDAT